MGIATILLERGLITQEQLELALSEHRESSEPLDRVMIRRGMVRADELVHALGERLGLSVVDLAECQPSEEVLGVVPPQVVFRQRCAPIASFKGPRGEKTLRVVTADPFDHTAADELRLLTGCAIELCLAEEEELRRFIRANYGVGGDTLSEMAGSLVDDTSAADEDAQAEAQAAGQASVVKLVNDILFEAVDSRATDVHIEPYEDELLVRYRIDGILQRANVPPTIHSFGAAIVSRIKIMASLNIAEKRRPQDGRITLRRKSAEFDLRVSVIPMLFGEGIVLRILNKSAVLMSLDDLGMPKELLGQWDRLIHQPHGILLVTGPTGSGKSTTLYGSLNRIVSDEIKAITVEDPVEYHVGGVNQIQVNHKVGLDFAAGLRSILRHDPDVIMIGEIRDQETAKAAVESSLTGHLVFSTLHTNDSAGAMPRMLEMGVEPYLVASSVTGVLAQRLVRRICKHCQTMEVPSATDLPPDWPGEAGVPLAKGVGCKECFHTGYRGRVGVYELLTVGEPVRKLVMDRGNASDIVARASADGDLFAMREDGFAKVLSGLTTISEVERVSKS